MKKLSKDEMKKIVGGVLSQAQSVDKNICSANCPGGCVATVECDGQCVAYDGEGAYCNKKDGGKTSVVC